MRYGWIVAICLVGQPVLALEINDHSTHLDQHQSQRQEQEQSQRQSQTAYGGASEQGQSQSADNSGNLQTVTTPQERTLYRGSLGLSIPEGNEGPILATPWGGLGFAKQSRMTKLTAYLNALGQYGASTDPKFMEVLASMRKACGLKDVLKEKAATLVTGGNHGNVNH